eukprot:TRINITY_DN14257_c0_g1_i2.p1 TRINITY_DN14257_c0_g1~~TRINITY_DN14257_c0_g1_i2.p1  ORF type:complete len:223 (-),score=45.63 TRINITY_DN14257_c0_g1_i2:158-826(-)
MDDSWDSKVAWDSRYNSEKLEEGDENPLAGKIATFDWHQSYAKLDPLFQQFGITPGKRVVMLGCGNSKLAEDMNENGFNSITGVDWSEACIEKMKERCAGRTGLDWKCMDVSDPAAMASFGNETQDVVIDKALFDTMMCVDDSTDKIVSMLHEVQRMLSKGGVYFLVTHGSKDSRMWYLNNPKLQEWSIQDAEISVLEIGTAEANVKCPLRHRVFACRCSSD